MAEIPAAPARPQPKLGNLKMVWHFATRYPGHIAAAQDTPSVHLFGPTDPRIFGPWGSSTRHIVLASTRRCAGCPAIPCGRLDWSQEELAAHPCVRVIDEREVLATVEKLLSIGQTQKS